MGLVAFGAAVVFCSCFHRLSSRPPGEAKPRAGPGRVQEGRDLLTLYGALYGASATPPPTLKGEGWSGWCMARLGLLDASVGLPGRPP